MSINSGIILACVAVIVGLNFFDTRINKSSKKSKDTWEDSGTFLVGQFRAHLESIADCLSCRGGRYVVYSRFNLKDKCAELYTDDRGVLARIYDGEKIGNGVSELIISSNLTLEELGWFKLLEEERGPILKFELLVS